MKTNDRNFDALLVEALSREEAEIFQRLGKPSVFDLVTDTVRGSMRWLNILGYVQELLLRRYETLRGQKPPSPGASTRGRRH